MFVEPNGQLGNLLMATHYTKDHEWIRLDGDVATVGITEHAQNALKLSAQNHSHYSAAIDPLPAEGAGGEKNKKENGDALREQRISS